MCTRLAIRVLYCGSLLLFQGSTVQDCRRGRAHEGVTGPPACLTGQAAAHFSHKALGLRP